MKHILKRLYKAIQFGSINQPLNTPLPSTARTGDIPVLRTSEVQFGSLPVTDTSSTHVSICVCVCVYVYSVLIRIE